MTLTPISAQRVGMDYRGLAAAREKSAASSDGAGIGVKSGAVPTAAGDLGGVVPVSAKDSRSGNGGDGASCGTCEGRKYQDGSDDPGVSFKTPTNIDPRSAASAVAGHEREHVFREQAKAQQENRRVISQSVALHTGICPECGKSYVSGGTTRTVTKADTEKAAAKFDVGKPDEKASGRLLAAG